MPCPTFGGLPPELRGCGRAKRIRASEQPPELEAAALEAARHYSLVSVHGAPVGISPSQLSSMPLQASTASGFTVGSVSLHSSPAAKPSLSASRPGRNRLPC